MTRGFSRFQRFHDDVQERFLVLDRHQRLADQRPVIVFFLEIELFRVELPHLGFGIQAFQQSDLEGFLRHFAVQIEPVDIGAYFLGNRARAAAGPGADLQHAVFRRQTEWLRQIDDAFLAAWRRKPLAPDDFDQFLAFLGPFGRVVDRFSGGRLVTL